MTNRGFTLVEVLVAMTIFAFVSLYTANSIRNAVKHKGKITTEIDNMSLVRDALKIIESDVNKAFNYHDYHIDLYNLAQKEKAERKKKKNSKKKPKVEGQQPEDPENPTDKEQPATTTPNQEEKKEEVPQRKAPPIYTHFFGSKNEMHFTTLNNAQLRSKVPVSDQAEVGYFLKNCRNRTNKDIRSNCLWRRVDPYLDKDLKEGGTSTVLIENVEEFELSYAGPEKNGGEWSNNWDSADNFRVATKNKFPFAVRVKLKVKMGFNKKDKSLSMTMVAPVRFTNNDIKDLNKKSEGENAAPAK